MPSLVGSEMCIRDSASILYLPETDAKKDFFLVQSLFIRSIEYSQSYILSCFKRYLSAQRIFRFSGE